MHNSDRQDPDTLGKCYEKIKIRLDKKCEVLYNILDRYFKILHLYIGW